SPGSRAPALVTFLVVGSGARGCWLGGKYGDRWGRTLITSVAMTLSGACALAVGFAFGHPLVVLVPLLLVWGITVVADSAQFSAAVSELAPRELVGTALTLQTSLGFLLTCLTIYLLPWVAATVELAGDFTDWQPVALQPTSEGAWESVQHIPGGVHRVNVRIDGGRWTAPAGTTRTTDENM